MAHELGHWANNDFDKMTILDTIYMTLFAVFLKGCVNNPKLLLAFGFNQKSLFISFYLFFKLYSVTIDYPIRKLYNIWYRYNEDKADTFAVELGYGTDLRSAIIRSFAKNLDQIFVNPVYELLNKSHPGFLVRITAVNEKMKTVHSDNQDDESALLG